MTTRAPGADREPPLIGLGARVHLFVRPEQRAAFTALFRDVLGCAVRERDFGFEHPILLVRFEDGSAFSVEFTPLAPSTDGAGASDDDHAFRGAWIEFRTRELDRLQGALRSAGIPELRHRGSTHAYFVAPGGQVFRLLDAGYTGP
ncbi:MAG: VOC family protein [Acidimicrobiales bacterium]